LQSGLAPTILFSMLNAAKETAVAAIRSLEDQLKQGLVVFGCFCLFKST
jgi:hypothetical protein